MTTQLPSKERLEAIAYGSVRQSQEEGVFMARALLAAYEQEPVAVVELSDYVTAAQLSGDEPRKKSVKELYEGALVVGQNLYTHPAPSIQEGLLIAWWDSTAPDGFRWKEGVLRNSVPDGTPVFAAAVAPVSDNVRQSAIDCLLKHPESYFGDMTARQVAECLSASAPSIPAVPDDLIHMAASAIEDLLDHCDPNTDYYSAVWADVPGKLRAAMLQAEHRETIRSQHAEWSQVTFGNVGPVGPLKHLSKEALEAAAEPDDLSEWADMQFLLWDAQRRAGITDEQISQAMIEKLAVNKAREWPEPKDGEPRLHIKSAPKGV